MKKVTPKRKASPTVSTKAITTVRGGKSNATALIAEGERIHRLQNEVPGGIEAAFILKRNSHNYDVGDLPFADMLAQAKHGYQFLQSLCYKLSYHAGWHRGYERRDGDQMGGEAFATKIALIHSELSEALEGFRKSKNDEHLPHRAAVEVELADAVIRIMDLSGAMGLDVAGAIIEKLLYNQQREDHKLDSRAGVGGKKF